MNPTDTTTQQTTQLQDENFPSGVIKPRMLAADTTMKTGDTYYVNSNGIFQRLASGSNGQALTVSSGVPAWNSTNFIPRVISLTGTTPTADCSGLQNIIFTITLSGSTTFAISNAQAGQILMFEVKQGSGTTYINTWFSGVTWLVPGGTAPVETTTSGGYTVYGFRVLTSSTFLGFLVGNN